MDNEILPTSIVSDSDSAFLSHKFTAYLNKHEINHSTVPVGDHQSLGVIDRFALTIKRIFNKYKIVFKSPNWIDHLNKVVQIYNNTEHSGLNDITPNQANEEKYKEQIRNLNLEKSKNNSVETDLVFGDKVRILLDNNVFKKGSENLWSSKVYTVQSARGKQFI